MTYKKYDCLAGIVHRGSWSGVLSGEERMNLRVPGDVGAFYSDRYVYFSREDRFIHRLSRDDNHLVLSCFRRLAGDTGHGSA